MPFFLTTGGKFHSMSENSILGTVTIMEKSGLETGTSTEISNISGKFHSEEWYKMEKSSLEKGTPMEIANFHGRFHSGGWYNNGKLQSP